MRISDWSSDVCSSDLTGDGGTYGYGRSSLYLAGKSRTILVDTLTSKGERRFMGARIGNSYQREINGRPVRFTGRHFWGKVSEVRGVEPVRGRSAASLARALGMPERLEGDRGTTLLKLGRALWRKNVCTYV